MKKHRIKIIVGIIILIPIVYFFLPSNYYLRRAIFYSSPNLEGHNLFECRVVKAGNPQPWQLSPRYNTYQLSNEQTDSLTRYGSAAFLVIKDGALLYEHYWDHYSDSSYTNSFSMAKSIISLLIGCALEDGYIKSLDEPVGSILPDFPGFEGQPLTIEHLLTMSVGLDWTENYTSPFSIVVKAFYTDRLNDLMNSVKQTEPSGKRFVYQSGVTQLLAMILEKVTGQHISDYASKKLWQPLGAEHDALWPLDKKDGIEKAYCCFYSNARDFARLGQLVLNKGSWNGHQLVPQAYIEKAIEPASYLKYEQTDKPNEVYGYQFWRLTYGGYTVNYYRGLLGQYILTIPSLNAVVVRLGREQSAIQSSQNYNIDIDTWLSIGLDILQEH